MNAISGGPPDLIHSHYSPDDYGMAERRVYGQLIPCGGGDPIPLLKRQLIVGRRSNCDITLRFPNVSSQHCELELIEGYWHVRDLNSSNGVKVNRARCDQKWLFPGDILGVGRHKFEVTYRAEGQRPEQDEDPFARTLMEKAGLERSPRRPRPRPDVENAEIADDDSEAELEGSTGEFT